MEIPNKREQKRDFKQWERSLHVGESNEDGEYIAPSRWQRFGRFIHYLTDSYESMQGPLIESFSTSEPDRDRRYMADPPDTKDDDGLSPT